MNQKKKKEKNVGLFCSGVRKVGSVRNSTFASHTGEMSHLPASYTSNRTPLRGIETMCPPPHFNVLHTPLLFLPK